MARLDITRSKLNSRYYLCRLHRNNHLINLKQESKIYKLLAHPVRIIFQYTKSLIRNLRRRASLFWASRNSQPELTIVECIILTQEKLSTITCGPHIHPHYTPTREQAHLIVNKLSQLAETVADIWEQHFTITKFRVAYQLAYQIYRWIHYHKLYLCCFGGRNPQTMFWETED
jgi:hypothetical protein